MRRHLETTVRFAALAVMLGGLAACATAADPTKMALAPPAATAEPFPVPLQHAMCVRNVTGGEETNPLWVSKVDNKGFNTALTISLDGAGLSASSADACHFPIDVNLLGLSQPSMGFDMTVTSHVNYKVYDQAGQPYLLQTIDTPYTANFSDAFAGYKRLQLANEGAISGSIHTFFDKLRAAPTK